MRPHLLALALLVLPASGSAAPALPAHVFGSGGANAAAGSVAVSAVVGDVLSDFSADATRSLWIGFYWPYTGSPLAVDPAWPPARIAFAPPAPNPAFGSMRLRFELPADEAHVELDVLALAGRRIRRLAASPLAAGRHAYDWDLRNERGSPVGPSLYLVRLRTAGFERTVRAVVTR